jgi:alkylation response protein AidB-like acyl-CoA dehydrogenase
MTPGQALAAADTVAAIANHHADRTESERRVAPDVIKALRDHGLLTLGVPRSYGGHQLDPLTIFEAIRRVSRGDASAGWVMMVILTTGSEAAAMSPGMAEEVYAGGSKVAAGVTAPMGRATPEAGGYRVSGRWGYGSGIDHVDWVLGGCLVNGPDGPEMAEDRPRILLAYFPKEEVTVEDTWHVLGVRGSGSHHWSVDNVFVPADRTTDLGARRIIDAPEYSFPVFGYLAMGIAAIALGTARRAIDEFVELAGGKKMAGSSRTLAERNTVQVEVARAEARTEAALSFMRSTLSEAWEAAVSQGSASLAQRSAIRLACTHAATEAAAVVAALHVQAGGASLYDGVLQRCFRDVHTATQHLMVAPSTLELTGRLLLGLETDTSQL